MRHENRERVHCHGTDLEVFQANERLHEREFTCWPLQRFPTVTV
jgi:hypothetical protein